MSKQVRNETSEYAEGGVEAFGAQNTPDASSLIASQIIEADQFDIEMARRLRAVCRGDSLACIALKTGATKEVVRRACQSGRPPARLLQQICLAYEVDGHWLLTGEGAAPPLDRFASVARDAPAEVLVTEVMRRLSRVLAGFEGVRAMTFEGQLNSRGIPDGSACPGTAPGRGRAAP